MKHVYNWSIIIVGTSESQLVAHGSDTNYKKAFKAFTEAVNTYCKDHNDAICSFTSGGYSMSFE